MKTVMITGVTGAVGSSVGRVFLEEDSANLVFLIRAESDEHLQRRLDELFAFWETDRDNPALRGRIRACRGDLGQPRLGLSETEYASLAGTVTHIIHCAGNVKLNQSMEEARRNTLEPLGNVIALARAAMSSGQFQKLDALSTVGVAGRVPGRLAEEPVVGPRTFHNTYEAAKAEGEELLLRHMGEGLPATIHRPSMVVGDSSTGKIIRFQVFYHLCEFLSGRRTHGFIADTGEHCLDIIPSDYVARALRIASSRQETAGRILHLCSGPDHAIRLDRLADLVRRIYTQEGLRVPSRLRKISSRWIRHAVPLAARLAPKRLRKPLATLPHFLTYLDECQSFDNAVSTAFLEGEGLLLPRPEEYLPTIFSFFMRNFSCRGQFRAEDKTHESDRRTHGTACSRCRSNESPIIPATGLRSGLRAGDYPTD